MIKAPSIRVSLVHFGYKEVSYYYWKWLKENVL